MQCKSRRRVNWKKQKSVIQERNAFSLRKAGARDIREVGQYGRQDAEGPRLPLSNCISCDAAHQSLEKVWEWLTARRLRLKYVWNCQEGARNSHQI